MDAVQIKWRVRAVRQRLHEERLDGLIVTGVENVRYLTGFTGHDSWAVVLPKSVVLVTDSRYTEQAMAECIGCRVVERKGPLAIKVNELLETRTIEAVGVEDNCTVATLQGIRKAMSVRVKPVRNVVEAVRMIKTETEVRLIQKASKIAFDAMDWALGQLQPGMTERQLAAMYVYRLSHYDATEGFETIVCFGPNGSRNHHQPSERKLANNDVLLLDFGANYNGYISDMTRCFAVGTPSDFYCRVYQTVARAQKAAIAAVRAGVRVCDVDAAARQVIEAAHLPAYGHGTGHGLGLQVHEMPSVSGLDRKTRLQAGQVITIEPGVYLPGKFGIRLEDDILVTDTNGKILSRDKRFEIDVDTVPICL
ncbi:MAG: aminopeptidase P family protein [Phycisphaerae bacterium]|jgi:Xaa-Pro aminopeptidase|nr:aminopeptidase P family protein [Phycisphaerae bacterium]